MADAFKFVAVFNFVDQMSDKLRTLGGAVTKFVEHIDDASESLGRMGERMVEWGEKIGVETAVLSEGADKLYEWSEALSEPAYGMQQSMAAMAAMAGLAGDALGEIKEHAIAFANTHPGVAAEQWIQGFTRMRDIFQDRAQAMRAEDTAVMLKRLGVEDDAATRLIQSGWSNLGAGAQAPFSEVLALSGEASRLLGGGRGATMFASMIQELEEAAAKGKATIDFSHGLVAALQHLKSQLSGTSTEKLAELVAMGLGIESPQLLTLLDNLNEVAQKQQQIADSSGALGKAYGTATHNAADQTALLHQNINNLYDAIYSPALSTITGWPADLTSVTQSSSEAAQRHLTIARYAALSLTALGGGAYYSLQGLAAFGTMTAFAGKGMQALGKLLDLQSHYLHALYAWDQVKSIASGIGNLGNAMLRALPSIYAFGAALLANPLTWYVAGAVALGAAAYEIYEHWNTVSAWLRKFWAWLTSSHWEVALTGPLGAAALEIYKRWEGIKKVFTGASDWLKTTGINIMKSLGEGILAGIEYPFKAAWQVAEKVGRLFHFHSPPDGGPLRAAVLNFRFGEELARHLKSAPIIGPAHEPAAGIAGAGPRGAAGSGSITINYSPQVIIQGAGSAKDELLKALRQHADEVVRIVESKLARAARLSFT